MKNSNIKHSNIKHSIIKNTKVNNMKNKGFTLIELVIVMVMLGTLAVTVAPRFLDISADANESVIQGVKGAINTSKTLINTQAILDGVQKDAVGAKVRVDSGQEVTLNFGYPTADSGGLLTALDITVGDENALPAGGNDFGYVIDSSGTIGSIYIFTGTTPPTPNATNNDDSICAVQYTEASSAPDEDDTSITIYTAASVEAHLGGC
jgi:MSHA pilin protein MshA